MTTDELLRKTNIQAYVKLDDLVKGKNYDMRTVEKTNHRTVQGPFGKLYLSHFTVDSETTVTYFDIDIIIENKKKITQVSCDCHHFRETRSCKHIAACFVKYAKELFDIASVSDISKDILQKFLEPENKVVKKELNVELSINIKKRENHYYYGPDKFVEIKVTVGENKMYILGNHTNQFMSAFNAGDGEVYFGKNFTYKAEEYFVSDENREILEAYFDLTEGYPSRQYSESKLKKFLYKIKDSHFVIENYQVDGIIQKFPIATNLSKEKDEYKLEFDLDSIESLIDDDYEYILYKGLLYHLNAKEKNLIDELINNNMENINIPKSEFNLFTKGLLGLVRKNLSVDATADDIIIPKDIKAQLYFDLRNTFIIANPKFIYNDEVIGYFDKTDDILRDSDFETSTINDLLAYGFTKQKNQIVLTDLEQQVDFVENGLEILAEKYEIFTTEKFKKMSIKKTTTVSSMFGIGQDNIFSYNFSLGDIKSDELVNIFKSIKNKKKYYKLKNGDILSLEDKALNELSSLSDDLELSDEDIIRGKGSILKYRAIYLDSLKNTKYSIINTDNLFDNFIKQFHKYKNCNLTLSKDELSILRDYQVTGVKWLYNLAKTGFGGILADEMGLGKTIQVIYYIKQVLKDEPKAKFLIVVPTSLAYNWDHEIDKFAPEIKHTICASSKEKRHNTLEHLENLNVIVTTYGLLREDKEYYEKLKFNTMIIDEAQNIKNNMAGITRCVKALKADTKFALTGTPLENSVLELWSIFDYIMPGYLASLTKFQAKYKIKDFNEDSENLIKGLSKQINPFILRRKKTDVVKELPDKLINDIYIDLKDEQKKLYAAELEKVKEEMDKIMKEEGINKARFLILQLLTKLRQICIDPSIVYENYTNGSNKIEQLTALVKEYTENEHKVLIFSSFKTALNIVKKTLEKEKIGVYMIDGSVKAKKRVEMVDAFNNKEEVKVFLIMLKSGGTGLNLTSADVVIHLDLWWNPQAENQATDRAHRIGQKNTVEVIHLISKGTIEEKILELQNKKRMLSDKLIDGEVRDKNILGSLTKKDIENLLSYENKD